MSQCRLTHKPGPDYTVLGKHRKGQANGLQKRRKNKTKRKQIRKKRFTTHHQSFLCAAHWSACCPGRNPTDERQADGWREPVSVPKDKDNLQNLQDAVSEKKKAWQVGSEPQACASPKKGSSFSHYTHVFPLMHATTRVFLLLWCWLRRCWHPYTC